MGMLNTNSHLEQSNVKHHLLIKLVGKAMVSNGRNHSTVYAGGLREVFQCTVIIFNPAVIFVNEASLTKN